MTAAAPARVARQPALGLAGIALVAPVALLLGAGLGSLERSLLVLGPLSTFALPVIAMVAFWWEGWPGTRWRAPALGVTDTLVVLAGGMLLTIAGQAIVAHVDLRGVLDPGAPPADAPTFPVTMALAGAIFVAMLQLTLVCEGGPLHRLRPIPGGLAALAVAWAAGVALYEVVVDGALLAAGELGALLACAGALQVAFYVVLRGRPFTLLRRRTTRLLVANAAVLAGGCAGYLLLAGLTRLDAAGIGAVAGSAVAAGLTIGMLFDGWLASAAANLAAVVVLAALLYVCLTAVAAEADWTRAEPEEWTAYAALNAIGAGVILHVAIGRRWPFAGALDTETNP